MVNKRLAMCIDSDTISKGVMDMAQTMVNFRMDEDVKRKMESACKEMGLSLSTAFNILPSRLEMKEEYHLK